MNRIVLLGILLFFAHLFLFNKAIITESVSCFNAFATVAAGAMFEAFKSHDKFMVLGNPAEHEFITVDFLLHIV